MFGRKQPPPIEQYSDDESEPLIEEVDPSYEPTPNQIRQYAIDTLGMSLPEDQNLLYLAREGLKAPIPLNWTPYQSREGEIYYKHKITQEKILDHPTDIEYRKKYEDQKMKMARKNLKSLNLKQSNQMLQNSSGFGLAHPSAAMPNLSGLSQEMSEPVLDEAALATYEQEVDECEERQEKQWKEWMKQFEEASDKKIKRIKQEYEEEISGLKKPNHKDGRGADSIIEEQKRKMVKNIEDEQDESLKEQLRLIEKEEEAKMEQYKAIYEQDNKIKIKKQEQELDLIYSQKVTQLEEKIRRHEEREAEAIKTREKLIQDWKQQLERPENPQFAAMLRQALQQNLESIKIQYQNKLKQKKEELQCQVTEMRKIMGVDKGQQLAEAMSKKQKLKRISDLKLTSYKNKQNNEIELQYEQKLSQDVQELKKKLERQTENKQQQKKRSMQQKLRTTKQQIEASYSQKAKELIQEIYQTGILDRNQFESSMNKRLSQIRMKYINRISNPSSADSHSNAVGDRILLQEKESQVRNKEELIHTLERQLEIERRQWEEIQLDHQICSKLEMGRQTVQQYLKEQLISHGIQYKSAEYGKYRQLHNRYEQRYKKDKKMLGEIMKGLQETASYRWQKGGQLGGSASIIKKYNEDVRKLRENEEMILQLQTYLKKAQLNQEESLWKLKQFSDQNQYKEIALAGEIGAGIAGAKIDEIAMNNQQSNRTIKRNEVGSLDNALRQHSKFLSTVKNQLNRKLYQVRYQTRY